jgi:ribonuclease E
MLEPDNPTTEPTEPTGPTAAPPARARKRAARKAPGAPPPPAAEPDAGRTPDAEAAATPADAPSAEAAAPRKRAPRKTAKKAAAAAADTPDPTEPADPALAAVAPPAKKATRRRAAKKAAAPAPESSTVDPAAAVAPVTPEPPASTPEPTQDTTTPETPRKAARKRAARKTSARKTAAASTAPVDASADLAERYADDGGRVEAGVPVPAGVLFRAPAEESAPEAPGETAEAADAIADPEEVRDAAIEQATGARRRRRRGRRGRGGKAADSAAETADVDEEIDEAAADDSDATAETAGAEADAESPEPTDAETTPSTSRRRRRRRAGTAAEDGGDAEPNTVVHTRESKRDSAREDDGVRGVKGSTRLEAKRQRRRDGRETTRRRAPILTEAEFLARREAVERAMVVRQNGERTQIAVLEDGILVEHYVTRASATSYVGNIYLGRVQNVLPSMEAAFIDIGKGRNGVLYAGEVNWDAAGLEGKSRAIESAMKSGDPVLVQVTKDPIGHKGARLTSQISLPGRFLVYVPRGGMTGISRRLPDTERHRLKSILKKIVPEDAGVIVRTAAEGATEAELTHDVERLTAQWRDIEQAAQKTKAAPTLLHGEPDLATRVVRDVFNEDFKSLIVSGEDAWQTVFGYVDGVAPELVERVSHYTAETDLFRELRIDEQLMKALDRKVWLPSGGSLVIDRTEAMTVIDVNTGKFVGSGGNLEETVTRNNLEAAEEIVRQLRLRDVGGIVVIDFIDMVLESNRELVLRRLTECLGRDRTKHQVAEVTSLGLVQMTRKRVGEGLLEAFSEPCEVCNGRGVIVHTEPLDQADSGADDEDRKQGKQGKRRRGGRSGDSGELPPIASNEQRQAANAAIAAIHKAAHGERPDDAAAAMPADEPVAVPADAELVEVVLIEDEPEIAVPVADAPAELLDVEPIEVEPIDVEPIELEPVVTEPVHPEPAAEATLDDALQSVAVTESSGAPAPDAEPDGARPAPTAQRRRRRVASRPAGPPTAE